MKLRIEIYNGITGRLVIDTEFGSIFDDAFKPLNRNRDTGFDHWAEMDARNQMELRRQAAEVVRNQFLRLLASFDPHNGVYPTKSPS